MEINYERSNYKNLISLLSSGAMVLWRCAVAPGNFGKFLLSYSFEAFPFHGIAMMVSSSMWRTWSERTEWKPVGRRPFVDRMYALVYRIRTKKCFAPVRQKQKHNDLAIKANGICKNEAKYFVASCGGCQLYILPRAAIAKNRRPDIGC